MLHKLCGTCYALRLIFHISNSDTLRIIYFACFYSVVRSWVIWASHNKKIFILQSIVRITVGAKPRNQCWSVSKRLEILPLSCEYIFLLMNFGISNLEKFQIHLYTVLAQGTSTIYIDQLPVFHIFRKVHTMLASK
jgi:hypothetical protein